MKNYHLVSERHQCPESFQEVMKIVQKSEFAAVIYFQIRMRKSQNLLEYLFMSMQYLRNYARKL